MKTKNLILVSLLIFSMLTVFADNKTEEFKVYGNCGMCQKRIEKAAKSVEGVTTAKWDKETKMLEISFDETKTDADKVQIAVANAGHDTVNHQAKDETYEELPGCCHYDRRIE